MADVTHKKLSEAALQAELEQHLANEQQPNHKNGKSTKTVKSSIGHFELDTPRDRSGSFEPQLVKKNQTSLTDEIDQKILFMFSMGMSYRDINKHIEDMYGMNVATGMNGRFKACISSPNEIGRRDCA